MRLPSRVQSCRLRIAVRAGRGVAGVSPQHMSVLKVRGSCTQSILVSSCDGIAALWQKRAGVASGVRARRQPLSRWRALQDILGCAMVTG